jgi:hypothetical protein
MGAQSLISGYFNSQELQDEFNEYYTESYFIFLNTNLDESEQIRSISVAKNNLRKMPRDACNTKP